MTTPRLRIQPCLDSDGRAQRCRDALDISRYDAQRLGWTAVQAAREGVYRDEDDSEVSIAELVHEARAGAVSIRPDEPLPEPAARAFPVTTLQVRNETTLQAARALVEEGHTPLALNFANGVRPGGGFLVGARAQEEVLCRSSALYVTLEGDPMYGAHRERSTSDSTDWAIYSPSVPVFRTDDGTSLEEPWRLSFLTCAAPYAPSVGQPLSGDLLEKRIGRVLAIARAYGYSSLVLGAWGCGAFRNDPHRTAADFRAALEGPFARAFEHVVFAIADWSAERRYLGPFREVFAASTE